jgi:ribosomal protein L21
MPNAEFPNIIGHWIFDIRHLIFRFGIGHSMSLEYCVLSVEQVQFELMLNYLIAEIKGKQYKVIPGKQFAVDFLGEGQTLLECESVLLKSEDDKLELGSPFVKGKVVFDVVSVTKGKKIRVAKYHAKANTRKVTGSTKMYSILMLKA